MKLYIEVYPAARLLYETYETSEFQWEATQFEDSWLHVLACFLAPINRQQDPRAPRTPKSSKILVAMTVAISTTRL